MYMYITLEWTYIVHVHVHVYMYSRYTQVTCMLRVCVQDRGEGVFIPEEDGVDAQVTVTCTCTCTHTCTCTILDHLKIDPMQTTI